MTGLSQNEDGPTCITDANLPNFCWCGSLCCVVEKRCLMSMEVDAARKDEDKRLKRFDELNNGVPRDLWALLKSKERW